jgi:hypothetical protein
VKDPKAPASFQSPAPKLRNRTNGSNKSRPSPAPSSEAFSPLHPLSTEFAAMPTNNAETVNQFGMRRLRKSVHAAMTERSTAPARIAGFKRASNRSAAQTPTPNSHTDSFHDIEKDPFCDGSEIASGEGCLIPAASLLSLQKQPLARIFT